MKRYANYFSDRKNIGGKVRASFFGVVSVLWLYRNGKSSAKKSEKENFIKSRYIPPEEGWRSFYRGARKIIATIGQALILQKRKGDIGGGVLSSAVFSVKK